MYDPVRIPSRISRRRVVTTLVMIGLVVIAIAVVVLRTMPHPAPTEPLTLEQLEMVIPDSAQTQLVADMVRTRLGEQPTTPAPSAAGAGAACSPAKTPHPWNSTQRANATMIVQVGLALGVPARGEVIALATAMQESHLYNLGNLGANNDHDSLGLFQQRPSMGWGSPAEVTDPVFSATAFYLALRSIRGWESMAVTVAAQSVQKSGAPDAYAQWEGDANALAKNILCSAA